MAEAYFQAPEAPGNATASAMRGIDFGTSLMERATRSRLAEQEMQLRNRQAALDEIERPLRMQKARADIADGILKLRTAEAMEQQRLDMAPIIGKARSRFNEIMRMPDPEARTNAALQWMGEFSQISNLKENQEEFKAYQDIIGKMYVDQAAVSKLKTEHDIKSAGPDSPLGKMVADYDKARAAGKMEAADWILQGIRADVTPKGMQLEVGPDGGIRFSQGAAGLTTPNTTRAQEEQYQLERLITEAGQLSNILRPGDLGIQGNISEIAGGFLGQIDPKLAEADVARNRSRLRAFREGALRQVSGDTRFTDRDRMAIQQILPEEGFVENLPQAKAKLLAVTTILAQRAGMQARRQGKESWTQLPPEELVKAAQNGEINKEAAAAILDALHGDWVRQQSGAK